MKSKSEYISKVVHFKQDTTFGIAFPFEFRAFSRWLSLSIFCNIQTRFGVYFCFFCELFLMHGQMADKILTMEEGERVVGEGLVARS